MTVVGAASGNGSFTQANFATSFYMTGGPVNKATSLVGQFIDFKFVGNGAPAPTNSGSLKAIISNNGTGTEMTLTCFFIQGAGTCGGGSAFTPNATPGTSGVAAVLDALGAGTGGMATALTALGALSPAQQAAALEKLTPNSSRGTTVAARDGMSSAMDQVSNRLDGLRAANGAYDAPQLAATGAVSGLAGGDVAPRYGFWTKAFATENRQGAKDGFAGYKGSGWGLAAGADRDFGDGLIAGLAFTYSNTSVSYRDQLQGNGAGIASYQLSAYGSQDVGPGYVEAMAAYSRQKYDSQRDTVVSGLALGNYGGDQWGLRIGGGVPYKLSADTTLVPQARLEWNQVKQNSYTETNAGALALNVAGTTADRLRSSIGAQLNHDTNLGDVKARPFARVFWNHDFKNDGVDSTASFVGGGTSFRTAGQKIDKDSYTLGVGVNLYTRRDFTATISYDHDMASGYRAHTAQAVARWQF
jgi:outer membrane autotransporter protein